jgi:hypothetical protein
MEKNTVQKRLSHYWEIFIRYIWWIVFVGIFNGLQYLQSIREELPPGWQGVLKVVNIIPDWNPVVWITILFLIALFIILESAHQRVSKIEDEFQAYKHEPPQMVELGKLHTSGVVLRNKGTRIKKEIFKEEFPAWQHEYEVWKRQVVNVVTQISVSKAQRIETVNRIPEDGVYRFPTAINRIHRRDLRTLEKRLEIVEKILNQYSGLD